ncbi:beta-ketoacyl synthase N-terminal-like domain-containing protein [uncultured Clostridium sp.]|uniref:beta-ketoacyl synthase N-terminal-like domain-containing protein n=1 Tax=Clostridium faecium TaxID=2762223 RepID=UPI00338D9B6D
MLDKVVVTGIGVICPCGNDVNEYKNSLQNGSSGISVIKKYDTNQEKIKILQLY